MNGALANFQQKTEYNRTYTQHFLVANFCLLAKCVYTVNKEVLKQRSGFFPTYIPRCKISTYVHVFRIPCSDKIYNRKRNI